MSQIKIYALNETIELHRDNLSEPYRVCRRLFI